MNKNEFKKLILLNFKNVPDNFFDQIEKYKNFLMLKNQQLNLTKFATNELIYGEYFYESIYPYKNLNFSKINSVLDIGSGSGIPGIIIKLMYPHIKLTIIDSTNKKCQFMNQLIQILKINDINVICNRAEQIKSNEIEKYDMVTSRAVAKLPILLEISSQYAKIGGIIVEPKSTNYEVELMMSKSLISQLKLKELESYEFNSENHHFHHIFIFQKLNKTPKIYPRSWKQIIKTYE